MNIFVFSDESGVFDKVHNDYFVFGGIMLLSKNEKDNFARKYLAAERVIRNKRKFSQYDEVKATTITNADKGKLFRSLNEIEKFGVVIKQKNLLDSIFNSKKAKQRYLDWAYKITVKRKFITLINRKVINPQEIENLYFYIDEHTTATDGIYELQEALEHEFKYGTHNFNYSTFYPPIFPNLKRVTVDYCDSKKQTLVRAADIVANRIYYEAVTGKSPLEQKAKTNIIYLPY